MVGRQDQSVPNEGPSFEPISQVCFWASLWVQSHHTTATSNLLMCQLFQLLCFQKTEWKRSRLNIRTLKDAARANSNETSQFTFRTHRASNKMSPRTRKKWNHLLCKVRTWWSTTQEARDFAATRASIWRHRRCQARSASARSEVGGSEELVRFGRPSSSDLTSELRASERGKAVGDHLASSAV